jgi:hypothetical protein
MDDDDGWFLPSKPPDDSERSPLVHRVNISISKTTQTIIAVTSV